MPSADEEMPSFLHDVVIVGRPEDVQPGGFTGRLDCCRWRLGSVPEGNISDQAWTTPVEAAASLTIMPSADAALEPYTISVSEMRFRAYHYPTRARGHCPI